MSVLYFPIDDGIMFRKKLLFNFRNKKKWYYIFYDGVKQEKLNFIMRTFNVDAYCFWSSSLCSAIYAEIWKKNDSHSVQCQLFNASNETKNKILSCVKFKKLRFEKKREIFTLLQGSIQNWKLIWTTKIIIIIRRLQWQSNTRKIIQIQND